MLTAEFHASMNSGFMPHGYCFLWTPTLLWTYVLADTLIAASYYSIPFTLWYFVRKRKDLPLRWVFSLFGLFVLACGTTHLIAVTNIWHANYWTDAGVKALTALISVISAVVLWRIIPRALSIPSRTDLEQMNHTLRAEVSRRIQVENELLQAKQQLEARVAERTQDLVLANQDLKRANRALETISLCNETLIHAVDETQLVQEMCQIIIENAGHAFVWIGYKESDAEQSVKPIAHAGNDRLYVERDPVSWGDTERGNGPSGMAIKTQRPALIKNTLTDPRYALWRTHAQQLDYRSVLALPLASFHQVIGVMTIYSRQEDGFTDVEIELLDQLSKDLAFGIVSLRTRLLQEQSSERLMESLEGTISAMSATMEMRDRYTSGHQQRVAEISRSIAEELGLTANEIHGIYLAAQIHDIGKIHIPAEILTKPGRLNELEYSLVKTHPQNGFDVLKNIKFPWPIARMVHQHHERPDGLGYPLGLKNQEICLGAKIIAVADVLEAMASHRPYRPAMGLEAALKEIRSHSGTQFDPLVVAACLQLFQEKGYNIPT